MDYGVILPHFSAFAQEDAATRILTAGTAAEDLGYGTLWAADHVVFPSKIEGGYAFNPEDPFLDPLTVLAALAYKTTKVKLGTAVLILPYRHPLAAAKALATIDVLSGGRLVVGVGAGWLAEEFTALGMSIGERGARTNEAMDIFHEVWTKEEPQYDGQYFRFSDIKFIPKPVQKPRPPILVGGMTKGSLRRTARRGDGWIAMGEKPDDIKDSLNLLRDFAHQEGRNPETLRICMLPLGAPDLDTLIQDVPQYEELGVDHLYLSFRAWTEDFSTLMKLMERFAREVIKIKDE